MAQPRTTYWMICRTPLNPAAKTAPQKRYVHRDEAVQAAQYLATREDAPFDVLRVDATLYPDTAGFSRGLFGDD